MYYEGTGGDRGRTTTGRTDGDDGTDTTGTTDKRRRWRRRVGHNGTDRQRTDDVDETGVATDGRTDDDDGDGTDTT